MRMYVWSRKPFFIAVAQARIVAEARILVLAQIESREDDASCPERAAAIRFINANTPEIWFGPNAEFALTDSAELREEEAQSERLRKEVKDLTEFLDWCRKDRTYAPLMYRVECFDKGKRN